MQSVTLFLLANAVFLASFILNDYTADAWAVRPFGSSKISGSCNGKAVQCYGYVPNHPHIPDAKETAFAPLGCACALVGEKCGPANSQCIGPNGERTGGIGTGTPKRGTCGCRQNWSMNCASNSCTPPSCTIAVSTSSITLGNCVPAFGTIPGITITGTNCATPVQFLIAASDSTDKTPYLDIDPNTFEVYANNLLPATTIKSQTYYVSAIDNVGKLSNQISFKATVNPASTTTTCTCT